MGKNICEFLESYDDFSHHNPVSLEKIRVAEELLNLKFADDYVECLLKYGAVDVEDIELFYITDNNKNRSVIHQTIELKELEDGVYIADDMYAIQDLWYDDLMAWQDRSGAVYISAPFEKPIKVANSLADYIEKSLNDELLDDIDDVDDIDDIYDIDDIDDIDDADDINERKNKANIISIIGELDDLFALTMAKDYEVENAERELGLKFADEYKRYVCAGGAICGGGIELTGITNFERLNVVSVTKREKRINPLIKENMYVVEVVGIDGMVILQDETGTIYTAQPNVAPRKFFDSLVEYIENVGRFSPNNNARPGFSFEECDEFGQDLIQRMENGIIPMEADGTTIHLHHMGLANGMPITISPLVELYEDKYYDPQTLSVLFDGFEYSDDYDRLECIKQKQNHWNLRSEEY